jgi:hypothetical protein
MLYLGSGLLHFAVPVVFVCPLTLTAASKAKAPANNMRFVMNPPSRNRVVSQPVGYAELPGPNSKCADDETATYAKSNPHFFYCHSEPAAFLRAGNLLSPSRAFLSFAAANCVT